MATQAETDIAVEECLQQIGQEYKISFKKFETEDYTKGAYRGGTWTYKTNWNRVSLEYWFSGFSSRKEEAEISYSADENKEELKNRLKDALAKLQTFVKRKKGMF